MILKRQEKNNLVKALYDSSNILASVYNNETNDLEIIFKAGTKYRYPNVSKSDYLRFEIAESQGVIFNTHIKKYSFEKLENVDVSKIMEEADSLIEEESEIKKKEIIEAIKSFENLNAESLENSNEIFVNNLKKLQTKINEYFEFIKNKLVV
jgi:hypothetical protein